MIIMLLPFLLLILYSSNLLKWYEVSHGSELVVKVGEGEEQGQDSQISSYPPPTARERYKG